MIPLALYSVVQCTCSRAFPHSVYRVRHLAACLSLSASFRCTCSLLYRLKARSHGAPHRKKCRPSTAYQTSWELSLFLNSLFTTTHEQTFGYLPPLTRQSAGYDPRAMLTSWWWCLLAEVSHVTRASQTHPTVAQACPAAVALCSPQASVYTGITASSMPHLCCVRSQGLVLQDDTTVRQPTDLN